MRPLLEKVSLPADGSWTLLNRRLEAGIPFEWHHHPEYELTLTTNSRGRRFVGDSIGGYDDGDNLSPSGESAAVVALCFSHARGSPGKASRLGCSRLRHR